jgi:hypothetical protein
VRTCFSPSLSQIFYCCWLVVELVFCYIFIVETKGLSLEETAALFDGKEIVDQIHARGHHTTDEKDSKEPTEDSI